MGSQFLEILRQGVWASLTGGWFFDPRQGHAANLLHLYLWLLLIALPFCLYMFASSMGFALWAAYVALVAVLFTSLKVLNLRLHRLFDTGEAMQEAPSVDGDRHPGGGHGAHHGSRDRAVELELLAPRPDGETPPVQCSSRNSLANLTTRVDSIEFISLNTRDNNSFDLAVQLARGSSGASSVGSRRSSSVRREPERSNVGGGACGISTQSVRSSNLSQKSALSPDSHRKLLLVQQYQQQLHLNTDTASTCGVVSALSGGMSGSVMDEQPSQASAVLSGDTTTSLSSTTSLQQQALPSSIGTNSNGTNPSASVGVVAGIGGHHGGAFGCHFSPALQATSADPFMKSPLTAGSVELGFMSQDPSVARARTQIAAGSGVAGGSMRTEGRQPVRRAHSEMETSASGGPGVGGSPGGGVRTGQPPSHPVSLEAISSQPPPPGAIPRRSMDYIRKGLSEETIQEDDPAGAGGSGIPSPITLTETSKGSPDTTHKKKGKEKQQSLSSPATAERQKKKQRRKRRSGTLGTPDVVHLTPTQQQGQQQQQQTPNGTTSDTSHHHQMSVDTVPLDQQPFASEQNTTTTDDSSETHSERSSTNFSVIYNPSTPKSGTTTQSNNISNTEYGKEVSRPGTAVGISAADETGDARRQRLVSGSHLQRDAQEGSFEWSFGDPVATPSREDDVQSSSSSTSPDESTPSLKQSTASRQGSQESREPSGSSGGGGDAWQRSQIRRRLLEILSKDDLVSSRDLQKLKQELISLGTLADSDEGEGDWSDGGGTAVVQSPLQGTSTVSAMVAKEGGISGRRSTRVEPTDSLGSSTSRKSSAEGGAVGGGKSSDTPEQQSIDTAGGGGPSNVTSGGDSVSPPSYLLASMLSTPGTHLARSHDDTSPGAVHCFRDEDGNWQAYTFNESGKASSPRTYVTHQQQHQQQKHMHLRPPKTKLPGDVEGGSVSGVGRPWDTVSQASSSSGATLMVAGAGSGIGGPSSLSGGGHRTPGDSTEGSICPLGNSALVGVSHSLDPLAGRRQQVIPSSFDGSSTSRHRQPHTSQGNHQQQTNDYFYVLQPHMPANPGLFRSSRFQFSGDGVTVGGASLSFLNPRGILSHPSGGLDQPSVLDPAPPRPRQYYLFHILPWSKGLRVKVSFDRLTLLAVLDRNITLLENFASVTLAVLVALLGALCLQKGLFVELSSIAFCFVMASCQYSLLKSVQPDAASPTHGYNHLVLYSRPVYFCLCCTALLTSQRILEANIPYPNIAVYNWRLFTPGGVAALKNFLIIFVLSFPVLFSVGLLPQVNTFVTYLCEQIDMHIFGGAATTGPVSAVYCLSRSLALTGILFGLCYTSLLDNQNPANNIAFSVFCGLLVTTSYHLSRSQSDPTVLARLITGALRRTEKSTTSNRPKRRSNAPAIDSSSAKQQENNGNGRSAEIIVAGDNDLRSGNAIITTAQPDEPGITVSAGGTISTTAGTSEGVATATEATEAWKHHEFVDPLPQQMRDTVLARLKTDAIQVALLSVFVFALHVSTMFTVLQPYLARGLHFLALIWGFILHYLLPQARKHLPWLCCAAPFLKSREHNMYESTEPAHVMWFERVQVIMWFIEKNALYPLVVLSALTVSLAPLIEQFGLPIGSMVLVVCSMRCLRGAFTDASWHFVALAFTLLIFRFDFQGKYREPILVNLYVMLLATNKLYELLLKLRFVITYIAPWQITWGSAFHAFAQPFSVPHSAMLFIQAIVSSALSAPLSPVLGSAIFFTSYVRPIKFWERDYNTKRVDHSNTRLSSQLERNPGGSDDNNLNSIFYEHLTRSLQKSLYGDLALGRWGAVSQGDCFVLASDNLNCLVHIVELANGLVTFQLRGLEFRGTYCQQREVEAMMEEVRDNVGCCCCEPGHLPGMLSANAAFNQRWLAWEVSAAKYILEGYSISDNSAVPLLQVFELRRALMTYYVKAVIFYAVTSTKLEGWLSNQSILEALMPTLDKHYAELDPVFTVNNDDDYDCRVTGISRNSFCKMYLTWIQYCLQRVASTKPAFASTIAADKCSPLVSLCFALSVLARRALGSASHNTLQSVDYLLFGLHALFKGDIRIACVRDEWVFHDMDLINKVVAPAVRMAFKLHQDHFMSSEGLEKSKDLFDAIEKYTATLVISHEADPAWRNAVLSSVQSLLALRHVADENSDDYKIITLNKRFLDFRVIKVNRECVRGLWAGQQQELVYLRNRNPERGSIQNAKQALRNIINSSCDQPIGYPIYVSPLTTSFAETSTQLCQLIGGALSLSLFRQSVCDFFSRLKIRCGEGCSSGGTGRQDEGCPGGYSAPASLSGSIARGVDPSCVGGVSMSAVGGPALGAAGGQVGNSQINVPPRRSHSSGSHLTNPPDLGCASAALSGLALSGGGGRTASVSSSTIGTSTALVGAGASSLGTNSASYVRTSLGNLTLSSLTKPGPTNVTVVSMRPFGETPFVIGESAGSRSTVFGTWDPQTGQLVPAPASAPHHTLPVTPVTVTATVTTVTAPASATTASTGVTTTMITTTTTSPPCSISGVSIGSASVASAAAASAPIATSNSGGTGNCTETTVL
ncbi:pecanex-like protein 1 isoform X2 [Varroa destructor]|uniref:Pecanex-like protein n=1 Tax=Varroa destructor TaxID=109461 RepID=A0A7M7KUM9_VARDE|nr:pecanex-like protein 1 isoform X2 [Varroa destructor]